jgi:ABC-type glycerol-3-phosphate transport system substrate-binding protein
MQRTSNRRWFLKSTGAAAAGTALAGCIGGDGGQSNNATTNSDDSNDLSGTSVEFWDVLNVQSGAAKNNVADTVEKFQSQTGATVNVNYSGYKQLSGAKWLSSFQRSNYPQVYTGELIFMGRFENGGWIRPFEDWKHLLGEDILSNIEWMMPSLKRGNRWMKKAGLDHEIYTFPMGFVPRNPISARIDHFEEASLDPKKDFPPKDYDHLIEVATTLQQEGPGKYGFQLFGDPNDWLDVMLPWAYAEGGNKGSYFNEDHTAVNFDNEVWKKSARRANEIFNEHGLSGPQTPSVSDEQVSQLMMQGQVSMSMVEWLNYPEFTNRAPDIVSNGNYQYGEIWSEPSGQPGAIGYYGIGLTKRPEGVDKAKWDRKQKAAVEFLKQFLSKDFQKTLVKTTGMMPVREDVWEEMAIQHGDKHNFLSVATSMAKKMEDSHSSHPLFNAVAVNGMSQRMQQMFRGELTPEEACNKAAADANPLLEDFWDENS